MNLKTLIEALLKLDPSLPVYIGTETGVRPACEEDLVVQTDIPHFTMDREGKITKTKISQCIIFDGA